MVWRDLISVDVICQSNDSMKSTWVVFLLQKPSSQPLKGLHRSSSWWSAAASKHNRRPGRSCLKSGYVVLNMEVCKGPLSLPLVCKGSGINTWRQQNKQGYYLYIAEMLNTIEYQQQVVLDITEAQWTIAAQEYSHSDDSKAPGFWKKKIPARKEEQQAGSSIVWMVLSFQSLVILRLAVATHQKEDSFFLCVFNGVKPDIIWRRLHNFIDRSADPTIDLFFGWAALQVGRERKQVWAWEAQSTSVTSDFELAELGLWCLSLDKLRKGRWSTKNKHMPWWDT